MSEVINNISNYHQLTYKKGSRGSYVAWTPISVNNTNQLNKYWWMTLLNKDIYGESWTPTGFFSYPSLSHYFRNVLPSGAPNWQRSFQILLEGCYARSVEGMSQTLRSSEPTLLRRWSCDRYIFQFWLVLLESGSTSVWWRSCQPVLRQSRVLGELSSF